MYFTEQDGAQVPLDPDRVEDYLQAIQSLSLTDCVTYSANDDDLQSCGLDSPELIIEVAYDGEDGASGTFTLNVSRDPDERAAEAPPTGRARRRSPPTPRGGPVQAALSDHRRGVRGADGRLPMTLSGTRRCCPPRWRISARWT